MGGCYSTPHAERAPLPESERAYNQHLHCTPPPTHSTGREVTRSDSRGKHQSTHKHDETSIAAKTSGEAVTPSAPELPNRFPSRQTSKKGDRGSSTTVTPRRGVELRQ